MRSTNKFFAALASFAALLSPLRAQDSFDPFNAGGDNAITQSALLADVTAVSPSTPFTVALKLTHEPGWHSYYQNDGIGISKVPELSWTLPAGAEASALVWPIPHQAEFVGMTTYGYTGTNYFFTTITPPEGLAPGDEFNVHLEASWQTCKESCVDEKASFDLTLPVAAEPAPNAAVQAEFDAYRADHAHQPVPDSWKVSAADKNGTITLRLVTGQPLPDELHFFESDQQIDAQAAQKWSSPEEGVWELQVPRNKGNDFSPDPGPVLPELRGILASGSDLPEVDAHGVWIETKLGGSVADTASPTVPDGLGRQEYSLVTILALAFLGGIILNLMPCVFPVLGIKIMGFVEQSDEDPKKIRAHGIVFAAGLLVSLWVLAAILIALLQSGKHFGWGFQLNDAGFLSFMIIILFVLGLNLIGVFEIGTSLTGVGSDLQRKKGYSGSFFTGVLTTLVATPCTGPFLTVAMGFALQQPAYISLIVFTALGLGIAFPYVLLAFNPKLIKKLPRPGAWMETLKKALAFPLFLWVVFLLNGFGAQTGRSGMIWLLTALVIIAIACWIYGSWATPSRKPRTRLIARLATVVIFASGVYSTSYALSRTPEGGGNERTELGKLEAHRWSPTIVRELQGAGHPVFVDYTADT